MRPQTALRNSANEADIDATSRKLADDNLADGIVTDPCPKAGRPTKPSRGHRAVRCGPSPCQAEALCKYLGRLTRDLLNREDVVENRDSDA
jgi:hypothetical protein